MEKPEYISTSEAAEIMGISRIAVFKQIKKGKLKAQKVGRSYVIDRHSLGGIYKKMTPKEEKEIEKAVKKVVKEFGPALKKLGSE